MQPRSSRSVLAPMLLASLAAAGGAAQRTPSPSRAVVLPRHVVVTQELGEGCMLRVRLERPEPAPALEELARVLRLKHCGEALPVIVWWLQPGAPAAGPPWGTAVFDPQLVMRLPAPTPPASGATAPAGKRAAAPAPPAGEVGRWRTGGVVARTIVIRREGKGWVVEHRFASGGVTVRELVRESGTRYREAESDAGNFYLIDARGDLELHDAEGPIGKAQKVP